jgi:hypothetical protein
MDKRLADARKRMQEIGKQERYTTQEETTLAEAEKEKVTVGPDNITGGHYDG